MQKWLKDRKGVTFFADDRIKYYSKMVDTITQTIEIMKQTDEVIELR